MWGVRRFQNYRDWSFKCFGSVDQRWVLDSSVYIFWKIKRSGAKGNQIIPCSKKGQHCRPHRLWLPSAPAALNLLTSFSTHYNFLIFVSQSHIKILRIGYFMPWFWKYGGEWGNQFKNDKKCWRDGSAARSSSHIGLECSSCRSHWEAHNKLQHQL